jgi:hypothetical protein
MDSIAAITDSLALNICCHFLTALLARSLELNPAFLDILSSSRAGMRGYALELRQEMKEQLETTYLKVFNSPLVTVFHRREKGVSIGHLLV